MGWITDSIQEFFFKLIINLVASIYWFGVKAYEVFMNIAAGEFFPSDSYQLLITNFYVVIGVIMLFIVAFSLLKAMIDPEEKDGGIQVTSKLLTKFLTSVIILIFLPTIFSFAFKFQNAILNQNSIGNLFGQNSSYTENSNDFVKSGASDMMNSVFVAFFNPNMDFEKCEGKNIIDCRSVIESDESKYDNLQESINYVSSTGNMSEYQNYATNIVDDEISFNWFLALLAGLFLIYVIISFCFDLGLRAVKLVFYQIIAPIPVFFRIVPSGKLSETFGSWVKVTLTCYLEVFIRIFAIFMGIFLFKLLPDIIAVDGSTDSYFIGILTKAFLVMGMVMFIKEMPKLLGEVTGIDSADMKLGLKEKMASGGLFAAGAVLGSTGTMVGRNTIAAFSKIKKAEGTKNKAKSIGNGVWSTVAGAMRGGYHGLKSGGKAKSFSELKSSINKATGIVGEKQQTEEAYTATHKGTWLGAKVGHLKDVKSGIPAYFGYTDIDSGEADRYSEYAKHLDDAHSLLESIYKKKPDHDKLKQGKAGAGTAVRNIMKDSRDNNAFSALSKIDANELASGNLSDENKRIITAALGRTASAEDLSLIKNYQTAKKQLEIHEYEQMEKKASIAASAVTNIVEAKLKFGDISDAFNKDVLQKLIADAPPGQEEFAKKLVNKISEGKAIQTEDLITRDEKGNVINTIDFNVLESVTDKIGIYAKELAGAKQNEVRIANANQASNSSSDNATK